MAVQSGPPRYATHPIGGHTVILEYAARLAAPSHDVTVHIPLRPAWGPGLRERLRSLTAPARPTFQEQPGTRRVPGPAWRWMMDAHAAEFTGRGWPPRTAQPCPFAASADGQPVPNATRRVYFDQVFAGTAPAADPFFAMVPPGSRCSAGRDGARNADFTARWTGGSICRPISR